MIYWVGIILLDYLALRSFSALLSYFWLSGFLFIRPSGFGLLHKSALSPTYAVGLMPSFREMHIIHLGMYSGDLNCGAVQISDLVVNPMVIYSDHHSGQFTCFPNGI